MRSLTVVELTATALILTACGILVKTTAQPVFELYAPSSAPPAQVRPAT
jgi:hypothetical protein